LKGVGAAQIAAAMAVWSSWGLFVRWLPLPPWQISFYLGLFSCATAAAWWAAGGGPLSRLWPREHRGLLFLQGGVFVANNVLFLTAYGRTTISNAILTHYTAPVFVAALAPLLLRERLLRRTPLAVVLAVVGMALLLPGLELSLHSRHVQGLLLGTGSGVAYAGLVLLARHLSPRVPAALLIFYQNAVSSVLLLPWALLAGIPRGMGSWSALALLGTLHATAAGMWYLAGIRKVRAQTAAVLGYLEPLGAVALAALFLGERPGPLGVVGGGLILLSGGLAMAGEGAPSP
jgi:drug/metabolite transporter (DMT)-like permease